MYFLPGISHSKTADQTQATMDSFYTALMLLLIWIVEEGTGDWLGGSRRVELAVADNQDVCQESVQAFVAIPEPLPLNLWLAVCPRFYDLLTTIASALPENAVEPERYLTQAVALLHECKFPYRARGCDCL